jgi:predicted RNase H-like nuclease (RuvC/YqgF family)
MRLLKIFIVALVLSFVLQAFVSSVHAQEENLAAVGTSTNRGRPVVPAKSKDLKKEMEGNEDRGDMRPLRTNLASTTDTSTATTTHMRYPGKGKLGDEIKGRVRGHLKQYTERYSAAIERVEKLLARVDSRIEKFEARGANVTTAKNYSASAKTKIATAKTDFEKLKTQAEAALASETPKTALKALEPLAKQTKTDIKAAHAEVVKAIAALSMTQKRLGTSTPPTTGSTTPPVTGTTTTSTGTSTASTTTP